MSRYLKLDKAFGVYCIFSLALMETNLVHFKISYFKGKHYAKLIIQHEEILSFLKGLNPKVNYSSQQSLPEIIFLNAELG